MEPNNTTAGSLAEDTHSASQAGLKPTTLVMVHGVGDATSGDILKDLSSVGEAGLNKAELSREDVVLNGVSYARARCRGIRIGNALVTELIEANWADILRPPGGKIGLLEYFLRLYFGMRDASLLAGANESPWVNRICRWHWFVMIGIAQGIVLLTMGLMLLAAHGTDMIRSIAILVAGTVAIYAVGDWMTRKIETNLAWIKLWAVVFAAVGVSYVWGSNSWRNLMIEWSAGSYAGAQGLCAVTLMLSFAAVRFAGHGQRAQRLARGGFLWLSFMLITCLLVLVWVTALSFGSKGAGYKNWDLVFGASTPFDLALAEVMMAGAMLSIFLLVPGVAVWAYRSPMARKLLGLPGLPGPAAHSMIESFLAVGPIALFLAGLACLFSLGREPVNGQILEIYQTSAVRCLGLLTLLLPAFRILADVTGDVLFHIQPESSKLSSRQHTLPRLEALLQCVRSERPDNRVVVVAHSQGSVIAATFLEKDPNLADVLVTVGCPLQTLYARFLGDTYPHPSKENRKLKWSNVHRDGDYIGGLLDGCGEGQSIGEGDHLNYWSDPRFVRRLAEILSEATPGGTNTAPPLEEPSAVIEGKSGEFPVKPVAVAAPSTAVAVTDPPANQTAV